jgi:hypothetical protein
MESWGFTTRRGVTMIVFGGLAFADCPNSGWSAYDLGPDDLAAAEAGLDAHWPEHLALARRHWGEPAYVGDDSRPGFLDEWRRAPARTGATWRSGRGPAPSSTCTATSRRRIR